MKTWVIVYDTIKFQNSCFLVGYFKDTLKAFDYFRNKEKSVRNNVFEM